MTHRRMKERLLGSVLASLLVPTLALGAVVLEPATAHAEVGKAKCQFSAVLLSKDGDGKIPKELEFLRSFLETDQFAIYKGYRLVDQKTLKLGKADAAPSVASFKSGHKIKLNLVGGDEKKLKLRLELSTRDGSAALVDTTYSIEDDALFMFDVGKYEDDKGSGNLMFISQCHRAT
jgi:hypothetical protein